MIIVQYYYWVFAKIPSLNYSKSKEVAKAKLPQTLAASSAKPFHVQIHFYTSRGILLHMLG